MIPVVTLDKFLRDSVVQCLHTFSQDEEELLDEIERLAMAQGDAVYPVLLNILTQLELGRDEAKGIWQAVLGHRGAMMESLGRPVNLMTALCDYLMSVKKYFRQPKMGEFSHFEKAQMDAKCDSLTGIYNRGFFEEALRWEVSRSRRYHMEFSLVFFDLDNFKEINDTLGHRAGDYVLQQVARLILSEKRAEDIVARFGGEEIVLILPETSKMNALANAERLRREVGRLELNFEGHPVRVTLSGGIATYPVDTPVEEELVECADRALYRAKAQGKNRVCLFSFDKRHSLRLECQTMVQVLEVRTHSGDAVCYGRTLDISMSGVCIESSQPFPAGTLVRLSLALGVDQSPLFVMGRVARFQPHDGTYALGIAFNPLGEQEREQLNRHFSTLLDPQPFLA